MYPRGPQGRLEEDRGGDQCLYRITYIVRLQDVIRKLYSDVLLVRVAFVQGMFLTDCVLFAKQPPSTL